MSIKLKLVRESKLHRLLPEMKKSSRLEASGVVVVDQSTCLVIFDNLHLVGEINLFLEPHKSNRSIALVGIGPGFEDIAVDFDAGRTFLLVEAMLEADSTYRGFVVEYDNDFTFLQCSRLSTIFKGENKGFEGLVHLRRGGQEYLLALCEGNLCTAAKKGGGRIHAFKRARNGTWRKSHKVALPASVEFEDYAALDLRGDRLAVVSQASARMWVGNIEIGSRIVVKDTGTVYRFPNKRYGNIEGIAWLSDDLVVAVSDRRKKNQSKRCADKDQSIHVFRIPSK